MMRIAFVGWGYMPEPPLSNSIYTLMHEYKQHLEELGHQVDILNNKNVHETIKYLNDNNYAFVHSHAYNFVAELNQKLKQKYCFTSHYGYLLKEDRWDENFQEAFKPYMDVPGIIAPSRLTAEFFQKKGYSGYLKIQPNGIDTKKFNFQEKGNNKAVCLGWIQPRKQQRLLAEAIDGKLELDFVGPLDDPDFIEVTTTKYLGIWSLEQVYANLTNYNCLVLISDGELAPLVVLEALAAGLCVVVSESASANLHTKEFIRVLPDNILSNATPENQTIISETIIEMIEKNQNYRQEIVEYAKENFDFSHLVKNYLQIIDEFKDFY
ncbi:glycosyltransferase family 4 protein [Nostoc sp. CENA67]|uniref:Glycosyltransferase family 4 protein n=1 Tax=Amazonocrinis nigriterrae CENA67 TaxID=2794033 RepID=A0A8J7HL24_9NOST|nr:glycosyltransferase family 4 protein [Amazonocrinis nigriterrae]MBH8561607.1 glycosyltransferase family 4 protein [Amazonocrinis nigriterrae CENA67]